MSSKETLIICLSKNYSSRNLYLKINLFHPPRPSSSENNSKERSQG
jgi:hypothetical protein